ncbi:MAG: O-methyltransferase [Acidimicrobiia bacterium]|nr:O-methyltransferase [Acidimicrobiia bacterium]
MSDDAPTEPKAFFLSNELADYVAAHSRGVDPVLAELVEQTNALGEVARMQVAPDQGAFLTVLTRALGTTLAVEVGTFTGYSSICIARGMAEGARLIACDLSDEWTTIARRAWLDAGVADRIELRLGPALDTLRRLPTEPVIDLAFIDADKGGYLDYYEELLPRLRPGGVLLADNVLWSGRVVDDAADDADTVALRAFNDHVARDDRVDAVLLTIADGLTMATKR